MAPPTPQETVRLIGIGLRSPIAPSARAAALAVAAKASAFAELSGVRTANGKPAIAAPVEAIEFGASIESRLLALAKEAAAEALGVFGPDESFAELSAKLFIALPAGIWKTAPELDAFAKKLAVAIGMPLAFPEVSVGGHASGLVAMRRAAERVATGSSRACIVLTLDSHLTAARLRQLDQEGVLQTAERTWGFIPGEAAACCVLAAGSYCTARRKAVLADLLTVAVADEPEVLGGSGVCTGEGLTRAFRGVLEKKVKVDFSWCDLNGESYRAEEFAYTVMRTGELFQSVGAQRAPTDSWGDLGAASAGALVALAVASWQEGVAAGSITWFGAAAPPTPCAVR